MQTVLKLNELPAQHCPRGVGRGKPPCQFFWFSCCLMAPQVLEIKRGTSPYTGLPASPHSPPATAHCLILEHGFGGAWKQVPTSLVRWTGRNAGIWWGSGGAVPHWWQRRDLNFHIVGLDRVRCRQGFHLTVPKSNWRQNQHSSDEFHPSLLWYLLNALVWSVKFRAPFYPHFPLVRITMQIARKQNVGSNRGLKTSVFLRSGAEKGLRGKELMFSEFPNKSEPNLRDWKPSGFFQFQP